MRHADASLDSQLHGTHVNFRHFLSPLASLYFSAVAQARKLKLVPYHGIRCPPSKMVEAEVAKARSDSNRSPRFGQGWEEMPDGSVYVGSFRYGLRDGQGVLTLNAEGTDTYEGHFRAGHFDGYGTRQWANGCVYKGHWKQGRQHGEGTLIELAGKSYRGQWHDGRRHGFGVLELEGHSRYEGRWENGMPHGSGKYTDLRNETVHEGQWLCGAHHGRALLRSKGGARERLQYNHGMLMQYQELPRPTVLPPVSKATGHLLTKKACGA